MIRAAHQEGASLREMAEASGHGHSMVKRVLDRVGWLTKGQRRLYVTTRSG